MGIDIHPIDGQTIRELGDELIALVRQVRGTSQIWNTDFLHELALSPNFCGRYAIDSASQVVGICLWHGVESLNPLMLNCPHLFLRRLVVKQGSERNGIGSSLLQSSISTIKSVGIKGNFLRVGWQTNVESGSGNSFFAKLGFTPIGRISVLGTTDNIYSLELDRFLESANEAA